MDTKTRSLAPVESPEAKEALVAAYNALLVLDLSHHLALVEEYGCDPNAANQAREAIATIEAGMSPNLLLEVIESGAVVTYKTDKGYPTDPPFVGEVRGKASDGVRVTTTGSFGGGWEHFFNADTVFTYFEVLSRGRRRA